MSVRITKEYEVRDESRSYHPHESSTGCKECARLNREVYELKKRLAELAPALPKTQEYPRFSKPEEPNWEWMLNKDAML